VPPPSPTPRAAGAVTIRGLAPELKMRLRVRAAHNARSMEAEARAILEAALSAPEEDPTDLAAFARALFAPLGGVELEPPPREPVRDPPDFGLGAAAANPAPTPRGRAPVGKAAPTAAKRRRR
jgi:plasmid stability protein